VWRVVEGTGCSERMNVVAVSVRVCAVRMGFTKTLLDQRRGAESACFGGILC
jgi:hypothetical protein